MNEGTLTILREDNNKGEEWLPATEAAAAY
jgi:hypothetical protein